MDGNNPNHLANLNYAVCVRVANGYCGIKYAQSSTDPYSFTISNDASGGAQKITSGNPHCGKKCYFSTT